MVRFNFFANDVLPQKLFSEISIDPGAFYTNMV